MSELTVKKLQEYLSLKYKNRVSEESLFMKLVEEMGETAEAMNQLAGRKALSEESSLAKELADVVHYTLAIASIHDIDLSKVIIEKDKLASVKYHWTPNLEEFLQVEEK